MIKIKKPPLHNKLKGNQIDDFVRYTDEGIANNNHEIPEKKI
jgi:hypothetical protein